MKYPLVILLDGEEVHRINLNSFIDWIFYNGNIKEQIISEYLGLT